MERIKVIWTFNPITVVPILGALVGGTIYINTIQNQVEAQGNTLTTVGAKLDTMSDLPYRMGQQEAFNEGFERSHGSDCGSYDVGQDATRKYLSAAVRGDPEGYRHALDPSRGSRVEGRHEDRQAAARQLLPAIG